jgi:SM-20-related protein
MHFKEYIHPLIAVPDWQPEHGGEPVLYADDKTTERARIAPLDGRLVLFLNEEVPPELRPTHAPRRSVAG